MGKPWTLEHRTRVTVGRYKAYLRLMAHCIKNSALPGDPRFAETVEDDICLIEHGMETLIDDIHDITIEEWRRRLSTLLPLFSDRPQ